MTAGRNPRLAFQDVGYIAHPFFPEFCMNAIKTARKRMKDRPDSDDARILSTLVLALENESDLTLSDLYRLSLPNFDLALEILKEWRVDRYYAGKAKLFDLSQQISNLEQ